MFLFKRVKVQSTKSRELSPFLVSQKNIFVHTDTRKNSEILCRVDMGAMRGRDQEIFYLFGLNNFERIA